jgi:hypothetical protein
MLRAGWGSQGKITLGWFYFDGDKNIAERGFDPPTFEL